MKKKIRVDWDDRGLPIYKTVDDKEKDSFQEKNKIKTKVLTKKKPVKKKASIKTKK